jgi:hypothetical protein
MAKLPDDIIKAAYRCGFLRGVLAGALCSYVGLLLARYV